MSYGFDTDYTIDETLSSNIIDDMSAWDDALNDMIVDGCAVDTFFEVM